MKNTLLLFLLLPLQMFYAQQVTPMPLPYKEDFESAIVNQITEGTYRETISGDSWVVVPNKTHTYNGNTLMYSSCYEAANAWFFSKPVYLTQGHLYKLEYLYGNDSPYTAENFRVTLGTKASPKAATILVKKHTKVTGAYLNLEATTITVPASGIYYIGIKAESPSYQGELYIDDLRVSELDFKIKWLR